MFFLQECSGKIMRGRKVLQNTLATHDSFVSNEFRVALLNLLHIPCPSYCMTINMTGSLIPLPEFPIGPLPWHVLGRSHDESPRLQWRDFNTADMETMLARGLPCLSCYITIICITCMHTSIIRILFMHTSIMSFAAACAMF